MAAATGNTWTVAQFPLEARQEVFAAPSSRIAQQLGLSGPPAQRVPGGHLLRGTWGRFCSGIDHADWIVAGVSAPPAPGAEPKPHLVLLPRERAVSIDDWYTSGLRGTGSRSFTVPELLVPDHRVLPLTALDPAHPAPHGRPRTTPYRMAFAAVGRWRSRASCWARRGPRWTRTRAPERAAPGSTCPRTPPPSTPRGRCSWPAWTGSPPPPRRAARPRSGPGCRRDIAYAGTRCREDVNAVYEASGSAVIYDDAPVQRIWRDANAAAQHPAFDLRRRGATPS
ncbi:MULTISPECIES: acyl-CoA dehydrogenase [unclassified Streptomyces]|uniref:acyl-CoA dehydrogenase n=1 Tax=unclassified Streptomyces TaxID=2593676 RepID=UPI0033A218F0